MQNRDRGILEQYVAGGACPELAEGRSKNARKNAHIRGRSHARALIHEISGLAFGGERIPAHTG